MIRPALPSDVPGIWALVLELARFERLERQATGSGESLTADLFGERPKAEALVAVEGGQIVGYSLFFPTYSTFRTRQGLWMEDLYVSPSHRGRGIGKALFLAVVQTAQDRGCARCEWSVLNWNRSAIEFYEAHGAEVLPDWRTCRLEGDSLKDLAALGRP